MPILSPKTPMTDDTTRFFSQAIPPYVHAIAIPSKKKSQNSQNTSHDMLRTPLYAQPTYPLGPRSGSRRSH